jgi:hypothetical protein
MTPTQVEKLFKILTRGFLALVALVVLVMIGRTYVLAVVRSAEEKQQRVLVDEVRPLIESCQAMPASEAPIPIRGKALIWDMRSDSRSDGHDELPEELCAVPADQEVTVFMIVGEHVTPREGVDGKPCDGDFTQQVDVCVAYWPLKQPAGTYAVSGKPVQFGCFAPSPDQLSAGRGVQNDPQYGDAGLPVAAWIRTLPRGAASTLVETAGR